MEDRGVEASPTRRRVLRYVLAGCGALMAWILLAILGRHSFFPNADSASAILAGRAMASGNVFLRHWQLPLDSYWTEELGLFGLWTRIFGVSLAPAWAVPAAVFAALGLLIARSASLRYRSPALVTVTAMALALAPIGFPSLVAATFGLQGPTHLATVALCLVVFALVAPTRGTVARAVGVGLLGLALVGDASALALGAAPVVLAGLARSVRHRRLRPAVEGIATIVAATSVALALRVVTVVAGGYRIGPLQHSAPRDHWFANLRLVPHNIDLLFGGALSTPHVWAGPTFTQIARTFTEAIFVGSVVFALALALRRPLRHQDARSTRSHWLDDVVLAALLCDVGFFVLAAVPPVDINSIRYLLPVLPLASILTGRTLVRLISKFGPVGIAASALAAIAVLAGGAIGYRHQVAAPRASAPQNGVVHWLEQHRMSEGLAGYWDAAPITLLTEGRVRVRAATFDGRRLVTFPYLADGKAVPNDHRPLNFVVAAEPGRMGNVTTATAMATFGPPASSVVIGQFTVMVWDHALAISDSDSTARREYDLP